MNEDMERFICNSSVQILFAVITVFGSMVSNDAITYFGVGGVWSITTITAIQAIIKYKNKVKEYECERCGSLNKIKIGKSEYDYSVTMMYDSAIKTPGLPRTRIERFVLCPDCIKHIESQSEVETKDFFRNEKKEKWDREMKGSFIYSK